MDGLRNRNCKTINNCILRGFKGFSSRLKIFKEPLLLKNQFYFIISKGKGKSVPLQVWSGPEGSKKLRFPDFMTTAQGSGKVVSLKQRPPLPPGNAPGTHFC